MCNVCNIIFFLFSRYLILNVLFLLVGIGSWMFHMSLRWARVVQYCDARGLLLRSYTRALTLFRYTMQLLDELPMVWGTGYMIYCMHMVRNKLHHFLHTFFVVTLFCWELQCAVKKWYPKYNVYNTCYRPLPAPNLPPSRQQSPSQVRSSFLFYVKYCFYLKGLVTGWIGVLLTCINKCLNKGCGPGLDLVELLERLTANVSFATVLGSIPASTDTVQSEGVAYKAVLSKQNHKKSPCQKRIQKKSKCRFHLVLSRIFSSKNLFYSVLHPIHHRLSHIQESSHTPGKHKRIFYPRFYSCHKNHFFLPSFGFIAAFNSPPEIYWSFSGF